MVHDPRQAVEFHEYQSVAGDWIEEFACCIYQQKITLDEEWQVDKRHDRQKKFLGDNLLVALNEIMLEKFNAMPSDRMAKYTDLVAGGRVELASVLTPVALPVPTPVAPSVPTPVPTPVAPSVPPSVAPSVPTPVPAQNEESEIL